MNKIHIYERYLEVYIYETKTEIYHKNNYECDVAQRNNIEPEKMQTIIYTPTTCK